MTKEQEFWRRILELSATQLKQTTYDFFVAEAKLIAIENNQATIFLDSPVKQLFWEQNLVGVILTAGFEIFNDQITAKYVFEEAGHDSISKYQLEELPEKSPFRPSLPPIDTGLKAKYTFDNFVQGDGNIWAKAAAIGNQILENMPDARVKYIPAETFINDFLEHLRLGDMDNFKKIYRSLDLLLIDDIQSLGGKKVSTQEEFFNTFDALHGDNKQIVLTSDRSPDHLDNLEERLVTRFKWGLTQNITPPDFETRIAILRNKIENLDYIFPNDTLEYLAGQFDSNVRDLEGALNDITLIARVRNLKEITIDIAAEAIRARKQDSSQVTVIPIEKIQSEVGNFYGVSVKEMKGSRRVQNIVLARQVAMYLARELTDNSLPKIGREFGGKDHTTVIHAHGKIKTRLETDDSLRLEIENIKNKIK